MSGGVRSSRSAMHTSHGQGSLEPSLKGRYCETRSITRGVHSLRQREPSPMIAR